MDPDDRLGGLFDRRSAVTRSESEEDEGFEGDAAPPEIAAAAPDSTDGPSFEPPAGDDTTLEASVDGASEGRSVGRRGGLTSAEAGGGSDASTAASVASEAGNPAGSARSVPFSAASSMSAGSDGSVPPTPAASIEASDDGVKPDATPRPQPAASQAEILNLREPESTSVPCRGDEADS